MDGNVVVMQEGRRAESLSKQGLSGGLPRWGERSTGRYGVSLLEGVAAHEVAARGRLSPPEEWLTLCIV